MNYFIEGLQGSGKSTLVTKLAEKYPWLTPVREGDYSPVELAWCAYVDRGKYEKILAKYADIRKEIEEKSHVEGDMVIICYTQIITDIPGFHKDLEQYEIYNNRVEYDEWKKIVLERYRRWKGDGQIFECSLFQNIVEDMLLFRNASDSEILEFYAEIKEALANKEFQILYIETKDIPTSIGAIRKERSDAQGNEMWFPLMMGYFNESPYAKEKRVSGEEALFARFKHRQELELKICREIFADRVKVMESKNYD